MKFARWIVLVTIFGLANPLCAQETGSIAGTIRNDEGVPLRYVGVLTVKLPTPNPNNTVVPDENGRFLISGLKPGNYLVIVSDTEHKEWIATVEVVAGDTATIQVVMERGSSDILVAYEKLTEDYVEWYSEQLRAMNEPPLCEAPRSEDTHAYRFLWLRAFDNPILVKIEIKPDGTGVLWLKITSGRGGEERSELIREERKALTEDNVKSLLQYLEGSNFWDLPTRVEHTHMVGLDGAQWITEGVKDGRCHIVDRWSPKTGDYRAMFLGVLIYLANLKVFYQDVY